MPEFSIRPSTDFSACAQSWFSDAVTTLAQIKGSRASLYLLNLMNGTSSTAYLQVFFQPMASVTLGTTRPDFVVKLPANSGSGFTQTISLAVPVGGLIPTGNNVVGSLGVGNAGPGTGLCVAGTTSPVNATTAAIGVTAVYL